MKRCTSTRLIVLAAAGALSFACTGDKEQAGNPAAPSPQAPASVLAGVWTSAAAGLPSPETCANFQWQVNQISGSSASGTFTATCAAGVSLSGQISATLQGTSTANWSASGTATGGSGLSCPFSATGIATLESSNTLAVAYEGTTCMGPVSGQETLRR